MQLDQKALIEEAVQASIDAGLAVNGEHGVAAARHAARFMFNALQAAQPVPVVTDGLHMKTPIWVWMYDYGPMTHPEGWKDAPKDKFAHPQVHTYAFTSEEEAWSHPAKVGWPKDHKYVLGKTYLQAALTATASAEPVADEGTYEEGYDEGLRDAQGHAVEVTQAVARWLDNHLGAGNWYDQAEDGFTADDVIQGLFETVRDPNAAPLPAQGGKADE